MKKFLSLVLALTMMMSLVTINAGAKEFTDDEELNYKEAVDVISEISVVDGYEDGSFKPQNTLTRGAAAKIICNLILGPTTAAELHADTAPYKDVPVSNTFSGYIAYCAKEGIISGYADGSFRPAGTLTGYAFMKMLLGALGYDSNYEGYTGGNWSINVAKQAIGIGLNKGMVEEFNGVDFVTREEAALYAFNTLKATMVDYDQKITTTINGVDVVISQGTAKPVDWSEGSNRDGNIKDDGYVQFAEEYFPKLYLDNTTDAFGRPAREWEYSGNTVGTYVNHDILKKEFTTEVTGRDLYDVLGKSTIDDYEFLISVDGETEKNVLGDAFFTEDNILRSNTKGVGGTGNGVLTQVYVDTDNKDVYIAVINTYLAVATDDYNEKKDEATYTVWSLENKGTSSDKTLVKALPAKSTDAAINLDLTVSGEDFAIEEVKEDDIVLVHVAEGEIKEIMEPEVLSEVEITAFKNGSWITVDGEQYDYNDAIQYDDDVLDDYDDTNMKDTTYNVYLDAYGYAIGVEVVEESSNYLFLTGMDGSNSNLSNRNVDANVIFTDGTMATVTVNFKDSENAAGGSLTPGALMNTWCKYTVNGDKVYTLTEIADSKATFENADGSTDKAGQGSNLDTASAADKEFVTLDKSHVTLNGITDSTGFKRVYANDNSVFLSVETEKLNNNSTDYVIISDVDGISTGIQNVNLKAWNAKAVKADDTAYSAVAEANISHGVYTLFDDDGYVIAAVVVGEDDGTTTNYAFVTSDSMNRESYDKEKDEYTWSREAIVNGELVTLTETGSSNPELRGMVRGSWYEVKYYADGTVRRVTEIKKDNGDTTVDANEFYANSSAPVGTYPKYVGLIDYVEKASDDNDTVVLYQDLTAQTYVVSVKGSTLQVDTTISTGSRGFAVSPSAKTVLIQDSVTSSGKVTLMDDIYEYTGGSAGLERAVRNLNDNAKFKGYIGAVIENGVATSVVIYDKTETDINTGIDGSDIDGVTVTLNDPSAGKVSVSYTGTQPTDDQAISAIVSEMNKQGYTVTNTKYDNSVPAYVLSTTRKVGGMEVAQDFTWDGTKTQMITIKVDGTNKLVANGTTFASLFTSPSATEFASLNGNMKATNDSTALSAGDEINTTLHVQVTVTSAVTATGATTGFNSGATTATAAADGTMTGYVQKGVAGTYKVVITLSGTATAGDVNLASSTGTAAPAVISSGATGTVDVTVTLADSDTNGAVTLTFTVTD
ncbi:S-layer homology domain-containing protein [Pusillibacter faecalis]|uniref:S-layer homology domain-containing protein n=1 Tax=Pusillibacter faecalis TaxID=2714358 RepID=UPI002943660B|nr:S-layer homology domain-containing protein [Pusillibacter faecalis]